MSQRVIEHYSGTSIATKFVISLSIRFDGTRVGIQNIDMPVLQVVGEFDNLIPSTASKPFNDVIPSTDTEIMEFSSGTRRTGRF